MNDPEEAIERFMTRLRDAQTPAGMEARVLGALEARTASETSRASWRVWVPVWKHARPLAAGAAIAAVCVIAALVSVTHQAGPAARDVRAIASPKVVGNPEQVVTQRLNPRQSDQAHRTAVAVSLSRTACPSSDDEGHVDYDSLAVSEMLAPSRPAPPLPLTHQEKLLAQVVHKGDPEQVADLQPDVRAKQVEIARAEFHDFFEPPPMKDNE